MGLSGKLNIFFSFVMLLIMRKINDSDNDDDYFVIFVMVVMINVGVYDYLLVMGIIYFFGELVQRVKKIIRYQ